MDPDIGHWVLEFLLRSSIPDTLAKKFLAVLPFSDSDSRLKKTILLRTIQDEVSKANVPEHLLEILEIFEELERIDGAAITQKMKTAYCAVAVECTVKYLEACPDNSDGDKYLDAVERIWRGRIRDMEESAEGSQLFTGELNQWRDDIEAALWNVEVCERLVNINSRQNALIRLQDFLAEAWAIMGPSFLEILAASVNQENLQGSGGDLGVDEHRDIGVGECVIDTEPTDNYVRDSESSTNISGDCVSSKRIELDNDSVCMREAPMTEGTRDNEQLGNSTETLVDGREVLGGSHLPRPGERGKKSSDPCNDGPRPSLMERNCTARTYEWDDTIDGLPEGTSINASRFHLHSPKKGNVSPLKIYKPEKIIKRREAKRWSVLEEDTLRAGVKQFGKGNWKTILTSYYEIFEGRTEVDLKDKWRNITK